MQKLFREKVAQNKHHHTVLDMKTPKYWTILSP